MVAITFDTHQFIKSLTDSGVPEAQAEAMARAQKEAFSQALDTTLATKSDIATLDNRLIVIEGELRLVKWMLALVVIVTVVPALKTLLG